jgi:cytochrome c peroxidase
VRQDLSRGEDESTATLGNAQALLTAYNRWKATATQHGAEQHVVLLLRYSKGLSATFTRANGQARLDLVDGTVTVEVSGLPEAEAFDVWLIDNRPGPGHSVKPEPGDAMIHLGSLQHEAGVATLQANLSLDSLTDFQLDLVVVVRAGAAPGEAGLLFGSPSLFQRLYYSEQRGQFARLGDVEEPRSPDAASRSLLAAPFRALIPNLAHAQMVLESDARSGLERLIAQGQRLFFNETFNGNGRTCGTCHPAVNNFTIDPRFIATLPRSDPLFVAETNRKLAKLENPALMRKFGLILENMDGFEDPTNKFVMRGVPHTLALLTTPLDSTGWSGDGAPGSGTLKDFATGAVRQHFTKSLDRKEGVDFRLPTSRELDALEAFQLSLGRQDDPNVALDTGLALHGDKPSKGQDLFLNGNGATNGTCNACHGNAGANSAFGPNFNTGVENFPHPAGANGKQRPRDGGFGQTGDDGQGGHGNGEFNTPPLVEAADTGPFFHNNAVKTIEEAVEFYNSTAFNNSPSAANGRGLNLNGEEVRAIAAFLRVLNALENIRASIKLDERALNTREDNNARPLLRQSEQEIQDAIKVLSDVRLHPEAVESLREARRSLQRAVGSSDRRQSRQAIEAAIEQQREAREELCVLGTDPVLCPE